MSSVPSNRFCPATRLFPNPMRQAAPAAAPATVLGMPAVTGAIIGQESTALSNSVGRRSNTAAPMPPPIECPYSPIGRSPAYLSPTVSANLPRSATYRRQSSIHTTLGSSTSRTEYPCPRCSSTHTE